MTLLAQRAPEEHLSVSARGPGVAMEAALLRLEAALEGLVGCDEGALTAESLERALVVL